MLANLPGAPTDSLAPYEPADSVRNVTRTPVDVKLADIHLSSLPSALSEILAPFDKPDAQGHKDGKIDMHELATFAREFKEFQVWRAFLQMPDCAREISLFAREHCTLGCVSVCVCVCVCVCVRARAHV